MPSCLIAGSCIYHVAETKHILVRQARTEKQDIIRNTKIINGNELAFPFHELFLTISRYYTIPVFYYLLTPVITSIKKSLKYLTTTTLNGDKTDNGFTFHANNTTI